VLYPSDLDFLSCFGLELTKLVNNGNIYQCVQADDINHHKVVITFSPAQEFVQVEIFLEDNCIFKAYNENIGNMSFFDEKNGKGINVYMQGHDYNPIIKVFLEPRIKCLVTLMDA